MQWNRDAFFLAAFVLVCVTPFLSVVAWAMLGYGDMRNLPQWFNTTIGVIALVGGFCMIRFRNVIRMLKQWREDQESGE